MEACIPDDNFGCVESPDKTDPVVDASDPRFPEKNWPDNKDLNDAIPWEYSTIPFDPNRQYTEAEKLAVMEAEKARFDHSTLGWVPWNPVPPGPSRPGLPPTPTPPPSGQLYNELEIPMAEHPKAFSAPPVAEATVTTPPSITRSGQTEFLGQDYAHHFGNDMFGAGYTGSANFRWNTQNLEVSLAAEAESYAKAFSFKQSIVRFTFDAGMKCLNGNPAEAGVQTRAFLLGSLVRDLKWGVTTSKQRVFSVDRSFFKANRTFMVGPVPVKVTADVNGGAGLDLEAKFACTQQVPGIVLTATPYTKLNAYASAGVNVIVASFGIQGSLNLINLTLPREAKIEWFPGKTCPKSTFTVNRDVRTLQGQIGLFAQIKVLFYKKRWDLNIANWPGFSYTNPLVNWSHQPC
jgi:hypothetical protein